MSGFSYSSHSAESPTLDSSSLTSALPVDLNFETNVETGKLAANNFSSKNLETEFLDLSNEGVIEINGEISNSNEVSFESSTADNTPQNSDEVYGPPVPPGFRQQSNNAKARLEIFDFIINKAAIIYKNEKNYGLTSLDGYSIQIVDGKEIITESLGNGTKILYTYENGKCISIEYRYDMEVIKYKIEYDSKGNVVDFISDLNIYSNYLNHSKQFGGDQGSLKYNFESFKDDKIVLRMLHECFPNASMLDYQLYLSALNSVGCGYVAFVNSIFEHFKGREGEFEEKFGFPMYNVNYRGEIDYNYEYLILDLFNFAWAGRGYTIQQLYGEVDFNSIDEALNSASHSNKVVSGVIKYKDNSEPNSYVGFVYKWLKSFGINANYDYFYLPTAMLQFQPQTKGWKKLVDELRARGHETMDYTFDEPLSRSMTIDDVPDFIMEQLEKGKEVIVMDGDFSLKDPKTGEVVAEDVGRHAMSVVAVRNGRIIVSSWGRKYIFEPTDSLSIGILDFEE